MTRISRKTLILMAAGGSAVLLLGAFFFQMIGFPPCAMCLWQRWPHAVAVLLGLVAYRFGGAAICYLGALAAATTGGLGLYHTGVERDWWEGPTSCTNTGGGLGDLSGADLLSTDVTVVMCDQVSWQFMSLSMASWNFVASAVLVALWIMAARKPA